MAVLTEAIEATERGAGAATAVGDLAETATATATVTITAPVVTFTVVGAARARVLARLMMIATIAPRGAVREGTMTRDATAAVMAVDAARPLKVVTNRPSLLRMNAIGVPSLYSNLPHG